MPVFYPEFLKGVMKGLLHAIFSHLSLYERVLPYNLNWQRRDWTALAPFLSQNPIHVIDVGARGESLEEVESLRPYIAYVGFEADAEEAARLGANPRTGFHTFKVLPYFLGNKEGEQTFHIYKNAGDSSQLLPNPEHEAFSKDFGLARSVSVQGKTLDHLFADRAVQDVDLLKLDTQGTEFDILSAGQAALSKALMIETEVEFVEMYRNQKLFHDVCGQLYQKGFVLLYLNRVFMGRWAFQAPTRGQMIFGDALFGLKDEIAQALPVGKKLKYITLLIQYGIMDYAHHLYSNDQEALRIAPNLEAVFRKNAYGGLWSKVKRAALMQLDKVIVLLLHLRGTNQLSNDSDRGWPIR